MSNFEASSLGYIARTDTDTLVSSTKTSILLLLTLTSLPTLRLQTISRLPNQLQALILLCEVMKNSKRVSLQPISLFLVSRKVKHVNPIRLLKLSL